jgi:plasmid stabilization system protein ParE
MSLKISYSLRASDEFEDLLHYITDLFGNKSAEEVKVHFVKTIEQIANNPHQFPSWNRKKKIRRCVISPQTTLYYSVSNTRIDLLSFRSNFMNPRTKNL